MRLSNLQNAPVYVSGIIIDSRLVELVHRWEQEHKSPVIVNFEKSTNTKSAFPLNEKKNACDKLEIYPWRHKWVQIIIDTSNIEGEGGRKQK